MSMHNEFKLMMEIFEKVIAQGHANVTALRARADRDLGMHMAMKLVESADVRNARRFQLEEAAEAVVQFNAEMRQKINANLTEFKELIKVGETINRASGVEDDVGMSELRAAARKLQQMSAEFEFAELGVNEVQSKIQAMV